MQRRILASLALVALLSTAGCAGLFSGPLAFSASPATASNASLQQTNYEHVKTFNQTVTRNFSAAGQSKKVKVTNVIARYHRTVDLGPLGSRQAAVFSVFSSPQINALGKSFNPLAHYSNHRLVLQMQSQYQSLSNITNVSHHNATVLGHTTKVSKYSAKATFKDGKSTDVYIVLTKVKDGSDYVVAVDVYPQRVNGEDKKIATLLDGLQHAS